MKNLQVVQPAKIIKLIRVGLGLTQTELGKVLGVKKSAISYYENGTRSIKADIFLKILLLDREFKQFLKDQFNVIQ